jgi:hypothetical protein
MSDRDFSENALFSKLFRLLCEITFGNLLSPLLLAAKEPRCRKPTALGGAGTVRSRCGRITKGGSI